MLCLKFLFLSFLIGSTNTVDLAIVLPVGLSLSLLIIGISVLLGLLVVKCVLTRCKKKSTCDGVDGGLNC